MQTNFPIGNANISYRDLCQYRCLVYTIYVFKRQAEGSFLLDSFLYAIRAYSYSNILLTLSSFEFRICQRIKVIDVLRLLYISFSTLALQFQFVFIYFLHCYYTFPRCVWFILHTDGAAKKRCNHLPSILRSKIQHCEWKKFKKAVIDSS